MIDRKIELKRAIDATAEDGRITPDGIIEAARSENSPLHAEFEWDDSVAAHEHRRAQARALLREVRYVSLDVTESTLRQIAYVHDPRLPPKTQGYIPLQSAARDQKLATDIMLAELVRCESALNRAQNVADVLGLDCEVNEILASVNQLKDDVRPKPASRKVASGTRKRGPENRPSL